MLTETSVTLGDIGPDWGGGGQVPAQVVHMSKSVHF